RAIWQRAGSKCEKCGSQFALQIDHCRPWALGGDHQFENLRLLCRNCNQRAAIETFGSQKMNDFLNGE
ncbi:MAG: HNH endonuclease, partial [Bdellovibrio sp.]